MADVGQFVFNRLADWGTDRVYGGLESQPGGVLRAGPSRPGPGPGLEVRWPDLDQ